MFWLGALIGALVVGVPLLIVIFLGLWKLSHMFDGF